MNINFNIIYQNILAPIFNGIFPKKMLACEIRQEISQEC